MGLKAAVSLSASVPAAVTPLRRNLLSSSSSRGKGAALTSRHLRISAVMATAVQPAVVVGGGRVGQALLSMGPSSGGDLLLRRGEALPPAAPAGPILVCTRNDDLDGVLDATPRSRWPDLVFFQNGMLDPWLESKGLAGANQVLAYFAVSKLGEPPVDGITDANPEGLTAAFGNWAPAVAARLQNGGLTCKVLEKGAFEKQMLEKLIWISAFMLVGARHPGATVGAVEKEYRSEIFNKQQSLAQQDAGPVAGEQGPDGRQPGARLLRRLQARRAPHRRHHRRQPRGAHRSVRRLLSKKNTVLRAGAFFRRGHGREALCLLQSGGALPDRRERVHVEERLVLLTHRKGPHGRKARPMPAPHSLAQGD